MGGRDRQESIMRRTTRSGLIATVLAIGAIAAPTAQASGLLSGWHAPGGPEGSGPTITATAQQPPGGPGGSGPTLRTAAAQQSPSTVPTNGFDYADAAVGAGVAGGVALLVTGGTLSVRRRSQLRRP